MIKNEPVSGVEFHSFTSDDEIFGNATSNDTIFFSTLASLPGAAGLTYEAITGNEDSIVPRIVTGNEIGHLRLYNSTRNSYGLIQSVNTWTNTITLEAAVPGTWQTGDPITTNSPTVASPWAFKYFEVDCSEFLSADVIAALIHVTYMDRGAINGRMVMHPYETEATGKRQAFRLQAVGAQFNFTTIIKIVDQKFCYTADFSGPAQGIILFRIVGYWE
jgi:hypothetical protein